MKARKIGLYFKNSHEIRGVRGKNCKGSKLSFLEIRWAIARSFLSWCFSFLHGYLSLLLKTPPLKDFKAPSKALQLFRVSPPYLLT